MIKKVLRYLIESFGVDFNEEKPMNEIHKKLAEEIYAIASMTLAESGSFYPIFFLIKDNLYMPVLLDHEGSPVETATYARIANIAADDQDSDAAIFVSEQWTITGNPDDEEIQKYISGEKIASKADGRKDFLNLVYITAKGDIKSLSGEIKHSANGVSYVEESNWMDNAFTNILTPWRQ
jgi:hypothetical protein